MTTSWEREKQNLFDLFMVLKLKNIHIRWRLSSFQTTHIVPNQVVVQIETFSSCRRMEKDVFSWGWSQKMRCFICTMMTKEMRMEAKFLIVGEKFSLLVRHMGLMIISTDWWQKFSIHFMKSKNDQTFHISKKLGSLLFYKIFSHFSPFSLSTWRNQSAMEKGIVVG